MPGLEDLYREIILDHYKSPRNRGELPTPPAHRSEGKNPSCGDEISVFLIVEGEGDAATVTDLKVTGHGCSISQASASMMTVAVKGKTLPEARRTIGAFLALMGKQDPHEDGADPRAGVKLGDLEALQGVMKFPVRIKCATLAWYALRNGLEATAPATSR
jgi:nitrogen fixation NifU-like protein